MRAIHRLFCFIYGHILSKTQESNHQITLFGLVMMINYPLFGVFWKRETFQFQQEFTLRLVATLLCFLLALNQFWPRFLMKALPVLWYFSLLFCLPFFFAYLTLLNHGSTLWLMNCVSAIFFLLLLTAALDALILMIAGVSIALVFFFSDPHHSLEYIPGSITLFSLSVTYIAAIILGVLFARDRENMLADKLLGLQSMVDDLAHDLQTPLASIHMQTELQETMLEKLGTNPELQEDLKESLNKISRGIEMGNKLISMQLHNIQELKFDSNHFAIHLIKPLLVQVLEEYPLQSYQKSWIQLDMAVDFSIWIDEFAFKNMIWNFLKNSLDCIEKAGQGKIKIWMEVGPLQDDNYNFMYFKDTAQRLDWEGKQYESKNEAFSKNLAYSQSLMDSCGGDVQFKNMTNEYLIMFPKVD